VKVRKVLALASSFAALSLGACSTTMMTNAERARPAPQASTSVAGTYLAANFAAAQGDVRAATGFYANSLKDDPANADLLERTFLFAAEAGEIDQAIGLTDRVLMQDSTNRPAHLVLEVGALAKKDYAAVIKDVGTPSPGLFAALTNRVIEAWARAGMRDFDGALNALDSLTMQRGVDGLRLIHRALILDYAGRDKDADEAYRQAVTVMGTGPRAADAYGRFLLRHNRGDEAKALYERTGTESELLRVDMMSTRDKFALLPRVLPFVILLAGLLTFGFFPRLLTDKLTPSVNDLVARFSVSATAAVESRNPASATQAALARLDPHDPRTALRFELYCEGVELANGFHELASATEQRARFNHDISERRRTGLPAFPPDEFLLAALEAGLAAI